MSVTIVSQSRHGNTTDITVSSDLTGSVTFYWYLDGVYIGSTTDTTHSVTLRPGDQARVDVQDSTDPAYDPITNAPTQYPARRTLVFIRSIDSDVNKYIVEQQANGGTWSEIGRVQDDPGKWEYELVTPRLTDLTSYAWRVTPVDLAGNSGTAVALAGEYVVRRPDAPKFSATFNSGPKTVTLAAA